MSTRSLQWIIWGVLATSVVACQSGQDEAAPALMAEVEAAQTAHRTAVNAEVERIADELEATRVAIGQAEEKLAALESIIDRESFEEAIKSGRNLTEPNDLVKSGSASGIVGTYGEQAIELHGCKRDQRLLNLARLPEALTTDSLGFGSVCIDNTINEGALIADAERTKFPNGEHDLGESACAPGTGATGIELGWRGDTLSGHRLACSAIREAEAARSSTKLAPSEDPTWQPWDGESGDRQDILHCKADTIVASVALAKGADHAVTGIRLGCMTPRKSRARLPRISPILADGGGPVVDGEFGFLSVNAIPDAQVYIDGKLVTSSTPLSKHQVQTGNHTVRVFYVDERKFSETKRALISDGRHVNLFFQHKP